MNCRNLCAWKPRDHHSRHALWLLASLCVLVLACAKNPQTSSPSGSRVRKDPTVKEALDRFKKWAEADYQIYNMPTYPPQADDLSVIPEYGRAGALMFVYHQHVPVDELVDGAIDIVPVVLLVKPDSGYSTLEDAVDRLQNAGFGKHLRTGRIQVLETPNDSYWVRDYGPIFIEGTTDSGKQTFAIDPIYESNRPGMHERLARYRDDRLPYLFGSELSIATYRPPLILAGGNFAADGSGTCYTSTETIAQNGGERSEIEKLFSAYFGCTRVIFLEALPGPTTRHIDMFFRIANSGHVVLGEYEPRPHPRTAGAFLQDEAHKRMERNLTLLKQAFKNEPVPVRISRMPMPSIDQLDSGDGIEFTYRTFLNYVHLRGRKVDALLVPSYPKDFASRALQKAAAKMLRDIYPNAHIRFIPSDGLIRAQGALHCITIVLPDRAARPIYARIKPDASDRPTKFLARWPNGQVLDIKEVRRELDRSGMSVESLSDWKQARDFIILRRSAEMHLRKARFSKQRIAEILQHRDRESVMRDLMDALLEVDPPTKVGDEEVKEYYDEHKGDFWHEGSRKLLLVASRPSQLTYQLGALEDTSALSRIATDRLRQHSCSEPADSLANSVLNLSAEYVTVTDKKLDHLDSEIASAIHSADFGGVTSTRIDETNTVLWFKLCERESGEYTPFAEVESEIRVTLEKRSREDAEQRIRSELWKGVEVPPLDELPVQM